MSFRRYQPPVSACVITDNQNKLSMVTRRMIVVTGATGQLGRQILDHLLTRMPASGIGASVRDPDKARDLAERGVRVRAGDFADPASLAHAFEGATRVLVVSAGTTGPDALRLHRNAIDAATRAGARIFYTSHMGAHPTSLFEPMPDHAATEQLLADAGAAHVSLRNGFYAASALMMLGQAVATGEVVAPEDGPVSWTAHADLAEAAAIALTGTERFDGPTPPLTAAHAHDLAGLAAIASDLTGRPIRRTVVADDTYLATLLARGLPPPRAELFVNLFRASRRGEFAAVDPTLERLLGRPPLTMRDVLAANQSPH